MTNLNIKRNKWSQAAVWLGIFAIYFNMIYYFSSPLKAFVIAAYNIGSLLFIFIVIANYVFPKYYHKRSAYFTIAFSLIIAVTLLIIFAEHIYMHNISHEETSAPPFIFHFMRIFTQLTLSFFIATAIRFMEHSAMLTEREKQLNEDKFKTELKLLKAQINPHFIFNALNNIYSLTYMKNDNAPDSVLKLSEMLRYVFYDCNKDKVRLDAEINYIRNYIAFQEMKADIKQDIVFTTEIDNDRNEISPMLFIPFIENAFKYSNIENEELAYIHINMSCNNQQLVFYIENSIPNSKPGSGSGMGIKNVKHRLNIIYRDHYNCKITEVDGKYSVNLQIQLDYES
nr:histidine kinase [uncultured Carboxylicivirga sp.]